MRKTALINDALLLAIACVLSVIVTTAFIAVGHPELLLTIVPVVCFVTFAMIKSRKEEST